MKKQYDGVAMKVLRAVYEFSREHNIHISDFNCSLVDNGTQIILKGRDKAINNRSGDIDYDWTFPTGQLSRIWHDWEVEDRNEE